MYVKAGLDFKKVTDCTVNAALMQEVQSQLNSTRAPMYAKLGPSPGLFPHIFVDGQHLYNNTWAAINKILCLKLEEKSVSPAMLPTGCRTEKMKLTFELRGLDASKIKSLQEEIEDAVKTAVDFSVSGQVLPVNFEYPKWPNNEDPDPNGEPSYVNVQALQKVRLERVSGIATSRGVEVTMEVLILEAFKEDFLRIADTTPRYLSWTLSRTKLGKVPASNITDVRATN